MVEIKRLIDGYRHFYKKYFCDDKELYDNLSKKGQSPKTLVLACSDSRVDPSIVTDADPGDIFVIRNVANLVPPFQKDKSTYHGTSAALEFAVQNLLVENIILLGHSRCAGIETLINIKDSDISSEQDIDFSFVKEWVRIAENPSVKIKPQEGDNKASICEKESLIVSYFNLLTYPWIKEKVDAGNLAILIWYFDISTGKIQNLKIDDMSFEDLI